MKFFLLLSLIIAFAIAERMKFEDYKKKHNLKFETDEENKNREKIFNENVAEIEKHNAEAARTGNSEWGITKFTHLTQKEFEKNYLGLKFPKDKKNSKNSLTSRLAGYEFCTLGDFTELNAPNSTDFRPLTPLITDQLSCGNCWAHAFAGITYSMLKIRDNSFNQPLSIPFLTNCDTLDNGCDGGNPGSTFDFLKNKMSPPNTWPSDQTYSQLANGRTCSKINPTVSLGLTVLKNTLLDNYEGKLKAIVANCGATLIGVDGSTLRHYTRGVFKDNTCDSTCDSLNHMVMAVGYGIDPVTNEKFWLIRNSWGTDYGENGYIRLAMGSGNTCNVACDAYNIA